MKIKPKPLATLLLAALLPLATACGSTNDGPQYGDSLDEFLDAEGAQGAEATTGPSDADEFNEIEWETLIPAGSSSDEIYARYEDRILAVEPGSAEVDAIYDEMQAEYDDAAVNTELAGEAIQLAGFVAPLTYDGELITEFLLVPYFGACIHVPAPPPNQTVMVTLEAGQSLTIEDSWGPVWVTGTLTVDAADTELATAGYSISGAQAGVQLGY